MTTMSKKHTLDFLRALIAGIASHILAAHSHTALSRGLGEGEFPPLANWLTMAVCLAVVILFGLWLKRSDYLRSVWAWNAVGGYLLLQWIAVGVHEMIPENGAFHFDVWLVASGIFFTGLLWLAYSSAMEKDEPHLQGDEKPILSVDPALGFKGKMLVPAPMTQANGLILFLSPLRAVRNLPKGAPVPPSLPAEVFEDPLKLLEHLPAGISFQDPASLDILKGTNWYMSLRGILPHVPSFLMSHKLDVIVIPSADLDAERPGSWRQLEAFRALVQRLGETYVIRVSGLDAHSEGVSYENPLALSHAVREAKAELKSRNAEALIVVDITSGQATCSAVGAALTLEEQERIQYVSTNLWSVSMYDLRYEPIHSPLH